MKVLMMPKLSKEFEEVQLIYKNRTKAHDRPQVTCARDAFNILYESWDKDQLNLIEECKMPLLDNRLRLMSISSISKGGMAGTVVDPRIIFSIALKRRAHRFILAHNHPAGTLQPSKADIQLTKQIYSLGEMMQIRLDDHLIITEDGYYSIQHDTEGFHLEP